MNRTLLYYKGKLTLGKSKDWKLNALVHFLSLS